MVCRMSHALRRITRPRRDAGRRGRKWSADELRRRVYSKRARTPRSALCETVAGERDMSRICGPILGFRGRVGEEWRVAMMVAHDGGTTPGALTWAERGQAAGSGVSGAPLGQLGGASFFGYEFALPMQADERVLEY